MLHGHYPSMRHAHPSRPLSLSLPLRPWTIDGDVSCPCPLSLTVILHTSIGSFFLGFLYCTLEKENCPRSKKKKWTWALTPSYSVLFILVVVLPSFVLPLHRQTPSHIPSHGMGHRSSATPFSHCPPIFTLLVCLPITKSTWLR